MTFLLICAIPGILLLVFLFFSWMGCGIDHLEKGMRAAEEKEYQKRLAALAYEKWLVSLPPEERLCELKKQELAKLDRIEGWERLTAINTSFMASNQVYSQ